MATSAAFVDVFTKSESDTDSAPKGMTYTENGALAHLSTGQKCLDFFFKVMARDKRTAMSDENIVCHMKDAWNECPQVALRLIANLRDIRGNTGKGERHAAEVCWKWLLENHPEQLAANMHHIPFFGRWKDLLDITVGTDYEVPMFQLYARQLLTDLEAYKNGFAAEDPVERSRFYGQISLAAKWAPTEKCTYDKQAKLAGRPTASFLLASSLQSISPDAPEVAGTQLMQWYRKTFLTPLRKVIGVVETYLCQKQFENIDFNKVPGVALKMYSKKTFPSPKRPELARRFLEWQRDVLNGKAKINSGTVDPYQVVESLLNHTVTEAQIPTLEAFYQSQIRDIRQKLKDRFGSEDKIPTSVFVADVSGSMSGTPMTVSIAMAIWGSSIAHPAWRDMFFTFSSQPSIVSLKGQKTLQDKVHATAKADWGGSTDLQATYDLILKKAQKEGLKQSEMPSRLVIVSDMQFNQACQGNVFTNLEVTRAKFRSAGYDMPIVVFWNVRGNTDSKTGAPALANEQGVIMISGFAKSLLTLIMEGDDIVVPTPTDMMLQALLDERYDRLTVV